MTESRYLNALVNGVPVVTTPAEIDLTTADQLRTALLRATQNGCPVVVADMTSTHFCDSAGLRAFIVAYKRARAEGAELRLVLPASGAVPRIFTLTGIDRLIPCFATVNEALAGSSRGASLPPVPREPTTR